MKKPSRRRLLAALLILVGSTGLLAVCWFFPYMARSYDGEWLVRHTDLAQWEYTQDRIHWFSWRHDDFSPVSAYGGKEWAQWIMERIAKEDDPAGCEGGHKIAALEVITNFSPNGKRSRWPEDLPRWQQWWEQHRGQSQDQWIVDGFAAVGVTVHNPPVKEDWPALLQVLGHPEPKKRKPAPDDTPEQPRYLYHNAFRCLRDSKFNPVAYALEAEITPGIKQGLLAYQRWEQPHGYWDHAPGRLFGAGDSEHFSSMMSRALDPAFRWGWGSASAVTGLAGLWLWRRKARPGTLGP